MPVDKESASIMQTCPSCGASIDTTEADPLARIPCPNCGEKVRVERSFNNFVLVETLGIGGMGTVYKARDTLLDRLVALKLLRKDLGEEIDYTARLQQEARAAAAVNHPNVIQVFSSGRDHGQFYLVMELVDHGSLDDLIEQRKRLPEAQVLETGIQVAKGLRAAYGKGLIHRDVKPANILFADEQTAKIGDFGLAGVAAEQAETRGEIWGTPYYVAPERLNNETEDFRSDIYSLGATLFHAIAGRAPIEGETNSAIALRNLKINPLELSAVASDVSPETARVLQRMIAPDPSKRFASYDELVAELEEAQRILVGDASARAARRRTRILLGVVVALVLTLIGGGVFLFTRKPPPAPVMTGLPPASHTMSVGEIERQSTEARKELLRGHHKVAHAAFARMAIDAKNKQPLYDWTRLQQGLAALVGREKSQARQAFQEIENAGENGFGKEDAALAKSFVGSARLLTASGAVPAASVNNQQRNPVEILALLPFAIKTIDQLNTADAINFLDQFINAQPAGKFAWIGEYKPLAQKYLDDCRLYAAWKTEAKEPNSSAALSTNLENLRTTKKKLKTHSAFSDDLSIQEKALTRQLADQQKTETTARAQERKKAVESELPAWNAALASYKQKVGTYDFAGARDAVKAAKVSEQSLKEAQAGMEKKAQWLIDWKEKLTADLNRVHFSGTIADIGGAQYQGINAATQERLSLKTPYGFVELPWVKLNAKTLLAVSNGFIQPNAPDAADRQWLCAVFAAETGQLDTARQLAEAAAKAKPDYRNQFPLLFPAATGAR